MNDEASVMPAGVVVRMILVRHGEPSADARGRCYGKLDVELSLRGREQAARAADVLRNARIAAVYASPRRRAYETAELIAKHHGVPVTIEEGLAEINFGDFEGLTYAEVAERYPRLYEEWMDRPTEIEFPNGESFDAMRSRVNETARRLRAAHESEQTFVIVAHGGVNRILLAGALNMNARDIFRLEQTYAGISVVDYYDDETPVVRSMNLIARS